LLRPLAYRSPSLTTVMLAAMWILTAAACAPDDYGYARFTVDEVTDYEACMSEAFPLEASFFAARNRANSLGLFLQTRGGHNANHDLVYLEIHQPAYVRARLGEPVPLSSPTDVDPVVVARLLLLDSCPDLLESLFVTGTVVFEALSPNGDRRIEGHFSGAQLVSSRTSEVIASIEGSWAYDVLRGPPHEEFFPSRAP
jgi:hypothetical protein